MDNLVYMFIQSFDSVNIDKNGIKNWIVSTELKQEIYIFSYDKLLLPPYL